MKKFGLILILIAAIILGMRIGMDIIALTSLGILILGVWLLGYDCYEKISDCNSYNSKLITTREFNTIGEKITIQLKYEDLEISKMPESCMNCPVGYMAHDCGRKYPLTDKRPDTCKLKEFKLN